MEIAFEVMGSLGAFRIKLLQWINSGEWCLELQNIGSGLPFPSPGDLPNPGIEPRSTTLQADSLGAGPPWFQRQFPQSRIQILPVLKLNMPQMSQPK